jgi:hypothetical protein
LGRVRSRRLRRGAGACGRAWLADSGAAGDDPFGDWGFETTFGPGASAAEPLQASTQGVCDLTSFFKGLGLDPANVGPLSQGELQAIGQLVRTLALGVLGLHAATKAVKDDLNAEDRTMSASKDSNPLKSDGLGDTKPRYLFGGRAASAGLISPEHALRELLAELVQRYSTEAYLRERLRIKRETTGRER